MSLENYLVEAKLAELRRDIEARALARTLTDLYGKCRCIRRAQQQAAPCDLHAVDPGLFRRLVWSGLGS